MYLKSKESMEISSEKERWEWKQVTYSSRKSTLVISSALKDGMFINRVSIQKKKKKMVGFYCCYYSTCFKLLDTFFFSLFFFFLIFQFTCSYLNTGTVIYKTLGITHHRQNSRHNNKSVSYSFKKWENSRKWEALLVSVLPCPRSLRKNTFFQLTLCIWF